MINTPRSPREIKTCFDTRVFPRITVAFAISTPVKTIVTQISYGFRWGWGDGRGWVGRGEGGGYVYGFQNRAHCFVNTYQQSIERLLRCSYRYMVVFVLLLFNDSIIYSVVHYQILFYSPVKFVCFEIYVGKINHVLFVFKNEQVSFSQEIYIHTFNQIYFITSVFMNHKFADRAN